MNRPPTSHINLAKGLLTSLLLWGSTAKAQPTDTPTTASPEAKKAIEATVAELVEATQTDTGYTTLQPIVVGASNDLRRAKAWRQWRHAAFRNPADHTETRLLFQNVEVEEYHPKPLPGGFARYAATALCNVSLNIAIMLPDKPAEDWPADPWQGEITLQKTDSEEAPWQIVAPSVKGAFLELPARGGNRLEQAVQVICQPAAMLLTVRKEADADSLAILVDATQRYVAANGHYPPARYFAELIKNEAAESRAALRRAFHVNGTTRTWVLNPALAGTTVPPDTTAPPDIALFWDGSNKGPYFLYAGQTLFARADGRIETFRAQDLQ